MLLSGRTTNQRKGLLFYTVLKLMRCDKPYGTMLLYWPCAWTFLLCSQKEAVPFISMLVFFMGACLMRACGCVINDIADKDFDRQVERTKNRPIASGQLSWFFGLALFLFLSLLALGVWFGLEEGTKKLGVLGFLLACIYPFAKRWLVCPQVILGLAFAWGIPMASMEYLGSVDFRGWLLYFAVALWIIGYDTIYALQDLEDDKKIGVESSARFFGNYVNEVVMFLYTVFYGAMVGVGWFYYCGIGYYISLALVARVFKYQYEALQKKTHQHYFNAFASNQWIGALITWGLLLDRLFS